MKISIRKKTTMLIVIAIAVAITIAAVLSVFAIKNVAYSESNRMLLLLCESGEKNLDSYFKNVEHSVEMVSAYAEDDLEGLAPDGLGEHIERVKNIFAKMANITNGVLTYYYRIDPEVSETDKGFWFVDSGDNGFVEHEPTDITLYDTENTSELVWFTIPKHNGSSVWLQPYITDNLGVRVISYNVPIYWGSRFIGVAGIEIDYSAMAKQVDNISLYENGYAFLVDSEGVIVYHPKIDVTVMKKEDQPKVPDDLIGEETIVRYKYNNTKKRAAWLPLENGMRLYVSAPVSEINATWQKWAYLTIAAAAVLLVALALMVIYVLHVLNKQKEAENRTASLEKALRSAEDMTQIMSSMSSLMANIPALTFSKDAETGLYLACNQAFAVYAGKRNPKEVVGLSDYDLFSEEEAKDFIKKDKRTLETNEANVYFEDVWDAGISGIRSLQTTKTKYMDARGKLCILGVCVDVTHTTKVKAAAAAAEVRVEKEKEKQELEAHYKEHVEKLSYQATHDELTGLFNRAGYDFILSEIDFKSTYFLMVDADNFKNINDGYGHETGDRIIVKIANVLKNNFRANDCICRIGGDEFVVFIENIDKKKRGMIASKIENINRELENTKDGLPPISVSVGIAYGSEVSDPSALLELADRAMYEAKRNGKHGYRFSSNHQ